MVNLMTREDLTHHHGKTVHISHGGRPATGLLDAHDVTKACLKNLQKNSDDSERADAHSVVYLTDRDIETMKEAGETEIHSTIHISDVSMP